MGRTLPTANQIILTEQKELVRFRRTLRREDQQRLDKLFAGARQYTAAISQANHLLPFESILLAMLLELTKEVERLNSQLDG